MKLKPLLTSAFTRLGRALSPVLTFGLLALPSLARSETVTITSPGNGNWTAPVGVTEIVVEVWGAGGGGGAMTTMATLVAAAVAVERMRD